MTYQRLFSACRFISLALCAALLTACAGRAANPVMVNQYGDRDKSCRALQSELEFIESEVHRLAPKTDKTGSNVALGVAGAFLLVPWFFMDFSDAEQIEVNAYRQRYNNLVILADEKECGLGKEVIPTTAPKQNTNTADENKPKV